MFLSTLEGIILQISESLSHLHVLLSGGVSYVVSESLESASLSSHIVVVSPLVWLFLLHVVRSRGVQRRLGESDDLSETLVGQVH